MKLAMVTGASGGLGKSVCKTLSEKGYGIIAVDLSENAKIEQELSTLGKNLIKVIGNVDFSKPETIIEALGPDIFNKDLSVLVNNAGISVGGKLLDGTLAHWNLMMNVNLTAPFVLCQAFVQNSVQHNIKGSIINVSSMVGIVGAKKPGYAASKAGILGLTKSVAMQSGPNVRCNAIYPGAMETPMTADWDEITRKKIAENTPIGRIADPEEIAKIVSFLADDSQSGFLTGSIINATGGQYLGQ